MSNIKNIKYAGIVQTYDLEVDHADHQFYMSNGMLTSNSHSVLYSMNTYWTAYLKAHYPVEFLLANLMAELNSNSPVAKVNIAKIKKEIRALKINILPPDLNISNMSYTMKDDENLLTGLEALKFVSPDAIKDITEKRPFKDFFDFMYRVDSTKVRSNTIQALVAAGCLDSFGISRRSMFLYCSDYRKKLTSWLKKHDPSKEGFEYPFPVEPEWSKQELYALEAEYLGEGFSCGKLDAYGTFFRDTSAAPVRYVKTCSDKSQIKCFRGEIKDLFECKIKKETSKSYGKPMLKLVVEDFKNEPISLTIFPDALEDLNAFMKKNHGPKFKLEPGVALHFSASVNFYNDENGLILNQIYTMHPPPQKPKELKALKVNIREGRESKNKSSSNAELDSILDDLEDDLYNEGFIDLDEND